LRGKEKRPRLNESEETEARIRGALKPWIDDKR
jgi:hypothetical protein